MEKTRTFFDNDIAAVFYDEKLDALFLQYKSKPKNLAEFIEVNQATLEAFQLLNTVNFVADIRKMSIISLEAQQWVLENLFPACVKHLKGRQLFHAQLMDPSEIMSKVAANNLKRKTEIQGFTINQFGDEESLSNALLNQHRKAS